MLVFNISRKAIIVCKNTRGLAHMTPTGTLETLVLLASRAFDLHGVGTRAAPRGGHPAPRARAPLLQINKSLPADHAPTPARCKPRPAHRILRFPFSTPNRPSRATPRTPRAACPTPITHRGVPRAARPLVHVANHATPSAAPRRTTIHHNTPCPPNTGLTHHTTPIQTAAHHTTPHHVK